MKNMNIKKFNKKDDYESVIQFLTNCYEENKNMVRLPDYSHRHAGDDSLRG